jgi:hypothetical protein
MRPSIVLLTSTFALLAACADPATVDNSDAGAGAGGAQASGGESGGGEGGRASTGGASGEGGAPGAGGERAAGGAPGAGGNGAGGASGEGGVTGAGGAMGGRGGGQVGGRGAGGATGQAGSTGAMGGNGGSAATYNPCPTNGDPCKVLPLGDSITFGIQYAGAYRVELFKRAVTASQKITFVGTQMNGPAMAPGTTVPFPMDHEGHSGYTINQIAAVAPMDVTFAPHIILLHIGTNDMYMSDPGGAPGRLSTFVDTLTSMFPNALLVVAKIIPYPAQATNVNTFNQTIPAMVQMKAGMGKHVLMVDLNTGFDTSTMLSTDGIHPNQTGYNFMGDTWYSVVGSLFPK